jgi:hypothetical protein
MIVYFTRYQLEGNIGGGGRRALQIINEFKQEPFTYYSRAQPGLGHLLAPPKKLTDKFSIQFADRFDKSIRSLLSYGIFRFDYFKWKNEWRKPLFWFWRLSQHWKQKFHFIEGDIVFVEDPYYFRYFVAQLKNRGIKVVAMVQNIETLFKNYCKDKYRISLLKKELHWMKKCDLVVTNSREEAFFLKNNDINVIFHRYYPPDFIEERLLRIRESRRQSPKENFLLMGNAANTATKAGMIALINIWKKHITDEQLCVVGYNTECLEEYSDNERVIFKGPLADSQFDDALVKAKAVICYQVSGPGALTRIAEMLVASIPVMGNSHALRSYYNINGVIEFDSIEEFIKGIEYIKSAGAELDIHYPKPGTLVTKVKTRLDG